MCDKCNNGLIPWHGRTDVSTFCECREPEYSRHKPTPDDYDFPMSDSFRGWSFEHCREDDPADIPSLPVETREIVQRPVSTDILRQVKRLDQEMQEHFAEHRKPYRKRGI